MDEFTALADPTRRQILEMLRHGELAAGDIARQFDVSGPCISQHLKSLRDAKLVTVKVAGQQRIYTLDPSGFSKVELWLSEMTKFWNSRLDALERALETDNKTKGRKKK